MTTKKKPLETGLSRMVKDRAFALGADLAGVADLEATRGLLRLPEDFLDGFSRCVCAALALPRGIFSRIAAHPTPEYSNLYQAVNRKLDELAFALARDLEKAGYLALPVPASQVLDWDSLAGAVSHKALARMAGLGWQGKSLLLVTPQYGPRVRLVSVLTNAPLAPDKPIKNRCGDCTRCTEACPAGAIKGVCTKDHYLTRNHAVDLDKCSRLLMEDFAKRPHIGAPICGVCISACPYANKKER